MTTFVLVHGAWHGGWCWERVAPQLERAGHRALTPTLAGLGNRASELTPELGLRDHATDVVQALDEAPEPVTVVGHSYAGLVVHEAALCAPDKIQELVLVEGWIGPGGRSLLDLAPDWFADGMRNAAQAQGDGWRIPVPDPAVVGVQDPDDAAWLSRHLTEHPLKTFTDPTTESGAGLPRSRAIVAAPGPIAFADMARALGMPVQQIQGGHDLMVTSPQELAEALLQTDAVLAEALTETVPS